MSLSSFFEFLADIVMNLTFLVTIQYLHSYVQNPFQISFADGIFAFQPMFSYGQRSKCADLLNSYHFCMLNSYLNAHFTEIITVFPQKIPRAYLPYRYTRGIYASLQLFYFSALSLFALLSRVFKLISL